MKIEILEVQSKKLIPAIIERASLKDMPLKKNGWQFTWRSLFKTEGSELYKLVLEEEPDSVQGILMLSLMYENMVYMNNIEIAPHNIGRTGKYDKVAGSLIAYGCLKSFELGLDSYNGYLTFESKTELIKLYQEKYGAVLTMGQRMFIGPEVGLQLIKEYLNQ